MPEYDLTQIRAGDHAVFDRLFDRYSPRVLGYLLRMGTDRAQAEDLTQETFLAAYAGRAGLRRESQPLAWLLGIARRKRRDRQRGARGDTALGEDTTAGSIADDGSMAERVVAALTMEAALDKLAPAEREILLLTAVEGLTYREAALVLEAPAGTLKWRVHEATTKLRQLLTEGDADNGATEQQSSTGIPADRSSGRGGTRRIRGVAASAADRK